MRFTCDHSDNDDGSHFRHDSTAFSTTADHSWMLSLNYMVCACVLKATVSLVDTAFIPLWQIVS